MKVLNTLCDLRLGGPRLRVLQVATGLRAHGIQKDLGAMAMDEFVNAIEDEIRSRGAVTVVERFG